MLGEDTEFVLGLAALAGVKLSLLYGLRGQLQDGRKDHLELVGHVSALNVYPVKSCRAVRTPSAEIDEHGLFVIDGVHDRCIMITNEKGDFMSGRRFPSLVLVRPTIQDEFILLDAPGMSTLKLAKNIQGKGLSSCRLWGDQIDGLDYGDEASDWISKYLNKTGYRLYSSSSYTCKRELWKHPSIYGKLAPEGTMVAYQDIAPHHLLAEETVKDLNTRLKEDVTVDNFRPNIVVSGCKAYDENDWEEIYIGSVKFTTLFACERCKFPCVDPDTGIRHERYEPTLTLRGYLPYGIGKSGPVFGSMLTADCKGSVHVGDPIYALRRSKVSSFLF